MKKLVLFAACAVVLVLSSCSNKAKVESTPVEPTPAAVEEVAPVVEEAVPSDSIPVVAPAVTE